MFKKLLLILAFVSLSWSVPAYGQEDTALTQAATLGEVFGYINNYHLKEQDSDKLLQAAIKGMLESVDDPYTVYFSSGELSQFSDELNGDFEGIGVELEIRERLPYVVKTFSGTPAQKAGMQSGDLIVAVENKDVTDMPLYDVISQLQGKKGTKVNITVRRTGQPDFQLDLIRNTVNLPTVYSTLLDRQIGYLAIESFGNETGQEIKNALAQLKDKGIKALIIDLRNNGGGYVDAASEAASYLLGKGKTVFITEYRGKNQEIFQTESDKLVDKLPMVVLINENSASASEILAGALQDYSVATLMGTKSYGKGTVQDIIPLDNGGALKLTVATYLTPEGRRINGLGLQPERYVVTPELQLYAAKQFLMPAAQEIKFLSGTPKVTINQEEFTLPAGMVTENDHFYVPLRFTLEALGYEVEWQSENNNTVVKGQGKTWLLPLNSKTSTLNGEVKILGYSPVVKGNTSYLPVEELRSLGVEVNVQGDTVVLRR